VLATASACVSGSPSTRLPGAIVVATAGAVPDDSESRLVALLRALGFQVRTASAASAAEGLDPVFYPETAAGLLDATQARAVRDRVRGGLAVAVEGENALSRALGIRFQGKRVDATGGRGSLRYELEAKWRTAASAPLFFADAPAAFKTPGGVSLEAEGKLGRGRYVFLSVPAIAPEGQVRFPGLGELLRAGLGIAPAPLERDAMEVYFEPGLRQGVDADELARIWTSRGIRTVFLAGWHLGLFRYGDVVRTLRSRGIRVYLWLAPPMVTHAAWDAHPECRELAATGLQVKGDWRSLFALEDPACMELAVREWEQVISAAPWDGVNIAELYFEGPVSGAGDPASYTPFHPWVRADASSRLGFDPVSLFAGKPRADRLRAFQAYRADLVNDLHRRVLGFLAARLRGRDLVVTLVDDTLDPKVDVNVGVDAARVSSVAREMGFRVEVEDPYSVWSDAPGRYERLRAAWDARGGAVVDVNVVDREQPNPTTKPSGAELALIVAAAAGAKGVAIYAESTVMPADWATIRAALASSARMEPAGNAIVLKSPVDVLFRPPPGWGWVSVDGSPAKIDVRGRALISSGTHRLRPSKRPSGLRARAFAP
jgi:hypothetical protein